MAAASEDASAKGLIAAPRIVTLMVELSMKLLFLALFGWGGLVAGPGDRADVADKGLAELIDKIDAKAATIETMKARFVQRKEISLLVEPVEMKGTFYLKKRTGIKLDFDPKEDLVMVMKEEELISLSPGSKKASHIVLKKRHGRMAQRLLSDKLTNLVNNFKVERMVSNSETGKEQHLNLTPIKRRVKKRFNNIEIWVNEAYLIHRIKVVLKDGDVYQLSLDHIEINPEIDSAIFDITIPDDYEMDDRMEFLFGSGLPL